MNIRKVKRRPSARDIKQDEFYHKTAWRRKRPHILARDNHQCQPCKRAGKIKPGNIVDHIEPIEQGGAKLDDNNLETICSSCHAKKSARERRNIKGGGSQNV